jgi:hypothetical protein
MKLVTPQTVQAVYEMLIQLPPFNRWNLPPSKDVNFEVTKDPTCYGEYEPEPHTIRLSSAKLGFLDNVTRTMAHEIIHMRLYIKGSKSWDKHDAVFNNLSHKVATQLGYDPKEL